MRMRRDTRQRAVRRWPMLAGLLALALVLPAQAVADEVLDANCPGPATRANYSALGGGGREAQTFRVVHTGTLTRAAVQVNNTGAAADFQLQILAIDAAGTPVGGPLSAATIPAAAVPSGPTTLDSVLSPALPVQAGQAYALVVTKAPKLLSTFSFPAVDGSCIGDTWYSNGPNAAWHLDVPGVDLLYQIFVDAIPGSGPAGGGGKGPGGDPNIDNDFELLNKKGRLFARVPGPGKLIVDDGRKPASTSGAKKKKKHVRNFVKRTKAIAKKAGKVPLRIELTDRAIRRVIKTRKLNTWGRVTYTPKGGVPNTLAFKINFHV
jgi:hypothetical protein